MDTVIDPIIPETLPSLEALYPLLERAGYGAGWNKTVPAIWPQPKQNYHPMQWRWSEARNGLHAAGSLIDTELAERRNLILVNPVSGNVYGSLKTIVAAYQMIRAGERARSHRHSPNALRLIVEGEGAYTVVDGQRLDMHAGDVVLTPGGSWHGHGNEGNQDCYWIDVLDVPLVQLLEPMFIEMHPDAFETDFITPEQSPHVFRWQDTEKRLAGSDARTSKTDGRWVELVADSMPTLRLTMHELKRGQETTARQTTANEIYAVVSGRGTTIIDGNRFDWDYGDIIAVPGWRTAHHVVAENAILFRVSDEKAQRALGLFRETE